MNLTVLGDVELGVTSRDELIAQIKSAPITKTLENGSLVLSGLLRTAVTPKNIRVWGGELKDIGLHPLVSLSELIPCVEMHGFFLFENEIAVSILKLPKLPEFFKVRGLERLVVIGRASHCKVSGVMNGNPVLLCLKLEDGEVVLDYTVMPPVRLDLEKRSIVPGWDCKMGIILAKQLN